MGLNSTCKIAIIENYALFSSGIKSLLHAADDIVVIAEGISPETLSLQLYHKTPDIILIDMMHCSNAGLNTIKKTKNFFPNTPLLLITNHDFSECFKDYLKYGTKGFIFTDDKPEDLVFAIKNICLGKEHFGGKLSPKLSVIQLPKKSRGRPPGDNPLTGREIDVLKLFCDGLTYKEIGHKLFISARTVETHKKNIMSKLKVSTRAEMIKYATRNHFTTS